jgi:hypothetical protein
MCHLTGGRGAVTHSEPRLDIIINKPIRDTLSPFYYLTVVASRFRFGPCYSEHNAEPRDYPCYVTTVGLSRDKNFTMIMIEPIFGNM